MAKTVNWLPTARELILEMVDEWLMVCALKKTAWGIPDAAVTSLAARRDAARAALQTAKTETTRTPVANAQCKEAFRALIAAMRDFKRRYFLTPPLTDADYVSLGLKPPDGSRSPSGKPTAQVRVETFLVGRHELGIRIIYLTGSPDDPENKAYRIWYSVVAPGETPPAHPEDLRLSFSTKRKKDLIEFAYEDSGKTAYFAVQVENGEKKGPWGPIVSTLIP